MLRKECEQESAADVAPDVGQLLRIERWRFVKPHGLAYIGAGLKHPIDHHAVKIHILNEALAPFRPAP